MNVIVQNVTQLSRRDRVNATRMVLDHWLKDFVRQYCETLFVPQGTFAVVCPHRLRARRYSNYRAAPIRMADPVWT